jgi:hypothetical protein
MSLISYLKFFFPFFKHVIKNTIKHPFLQYDMWRTPNSLKDSNVIPKQKTAKKQGVGARSLARNTLEG